METVLSIAIGVLYAAATYLLLGRTLIRLVVGVFVLSNATNLLIFTAGRLTREVPPLIPEGGGPLPETVANPLPQALILTAIVIGFALFAFILVLTWRCWQELGTLDTDRMRAAEPRWLAETPHPRARARRDRGRGRDTAPGAVAADLPEEPAAESGRTEALP